MTEIKKSYGGFWKRVIAYLIDAFIIAFPVTMIFGTVIPQAMMTDNVQVYKYTGYYSDHTDGRLCSYTPL